MTWHYAVAVHWDGTHVLIEAYLNDRGRPDGWCRASPQGEDMKELRKDMALINKAVKTGPLYRLTKAEKILRIT